MENGNTRNCSYKNKRRKEVYFKLWEYVVSKTPNDSKKYMIKFIKKYTGHVWSISCVRTKTSINEVCRKNKKWYTLHFTYFYSKQSRSGKVLKKLWISKDWFILETRFPNISLNTECGKPIFNTLCVQGRITWMRFVSMKIKHVSIHSYWTLFYLLN